MSLTVHKPITQEFITRMRNGVPYFGYRNPQMPR
jgi:hypothetical protein